MIWRILESAGVAIGSLFVGYAVLTYRARRRMRSDFDYALRAVAAGAVKRAREEQRIELDYSPASIERLEAMLGELHNRHLQKPMEEKEIIILSRRWGAYIGEVMKRMRPGKWRRDSEKAGPGAMPLIFDDGLEAFPLCLGLQKNCGWPGRQYCLQVSGVFRSPAARRYKDGKLSIRKIRLQLKAPPSNSEAFCFLFSG